MERICVKVLAAVHQHLLCTPFYVPTTGVQTTAQEVNHLHCDFVLCDMWMPYKINEEPSNEGPFNWSLVAGSGNKLDGEFEGSHFEGKEIIESPKSTMWP